MKNTPQNLLLGNLWIQNNSKTTALQQKHSLVAAPNKIKYEPLIHSQESSPIKKINTLLSNTPVDNKANLAQLKAQKVTQDFVHNSPKNEAVATKLYSSWQELNNQIIGCEQCSLCNGRTNIVIERGNRAAKWMFIGEGPGEQEDLQGKPFVGASGQLLDKMIVAMKLNPIEDVYITNVVKCRPPFNRNPEKEEITACSNYLFSQIELVKPDIIITLGRFAAQTLLKSEVAVGKLRNKIHNYQGIPLVVTYHPSYLLRTPSAKKEAWNDLQLALKTFAEL